MQTRTLQITANSAASPEQVWALLADVQTWSEWGVFDQSTLERPGDAHPQGVGAIRRFRTGRINNLEEVVDFEPTRSFSYEVRNSNIPMRDHRGDVTLAPTSDGGTAITCSAGSLRELTPPALLAPRRAALGGGRAL